MNCDNEPNNHLCSDANSLIGDSNLSAIQLKAALFELGSQVPASDFPLLNKIRDAVVEYACSNDGPECEVLKKFVSLENMLEQQIEG